MTFYDDESNKVEYDFYHTINPAGEPDTLAVNPNIIYDIQVHTNPPIWRKDVGVVPFQYNVVQREAPQGSLRVLVRGESLKRGIRCITRQEDAWVNVQNSGETVKYLVGDYRLEILTLPVITAEQVRIEQNQTTTIEIPAPGYVTFRKHTSSYGAIYMPDGDAWTEVYELAPDADQETLALQPGDYKVIFRYANDPDMDNTREADFQVSSGTTLTLKL